MKTIKACMVAAALLLAGTGFANAVFPASRVGVCSWSWATNMTTILEQMVTMGVKHMQLSLVPWVKPLGGIEYPASLRETFGKGETGDVFVSISNRIAKGGGSRSVASASASCQAKRTFRLLRRRSRVI